MSAPEGLTVRCSGATALRRRWYRSLAFALRSTAPPCGALFEATAADPVPRVTVRPAALVETVRAAPSLSGLRLEPFPSPPAHEPPRPGAEWLRVLAATGGSHPVAGGPLPLCDAPELGRLAGHDGWLAFQTAWWRGTGGTLWVFRRFRLVMPTGIALLEAGPSIDAAVAEEWAEATGVAVAAVPAPARSRRDWRRGTLRAVPDEAWLRLPAERLERTAEVRASAAAGPSERSDGHRAVFGASGSGKTTYLAREAADHASRGGGLFVIDLHGDLGPAVVRRLGPGARARSVTIDASDPPVPGIAALGGRGGADDRAAAHLVAALKRLSPDGAEIHWGFRLERIFDSFVRLVQEREGSLVDLYALLTDADRRDEARLATRRPDLARFLSELAPVLKRQPDFLWSAATRLSKVVLMPALAELLAPADGGLPLEALLEEGRAIVVRLPFGQLGPEAAGFAGTLVLARAYLGLAGRRPPGGGSPPVLFVLDEAQAFAPRLVAELLAESRKFGLRVILATQYPDRFALELKNAVAGTVTDLVAFRVPRRSARGVGEWVGLPGEEADRWLPSLPPGHGIALDPDGTGIRPVVPSDEPGVPEAVWAERVDATREEFAVVPGPAGPPDDEEIAVERLLLAVLAAVERGGPLGASGVVDAARDLPGPPIDAAPLRAAWSRVERAGLVAVDADGVRLTTAGERRLGLTAPTLATRETAEHRALLLAAFRLFARRGYRIEIVRQGRYDTTLPDAIFRQLGGRRELTPEALRLAIERVRPGWAWRFFGGRDVHLEAEVSGALRPDRIRHGWRKATARGAFPLFLVADARRARKVRTTLRALGAGPDRAQVWTIPGSRRFASPGTDPNP